MKTSKSFFIAFIILFLLNGIANGERENINYINYKAILINSVKEIIQVRKFKCEDKIILYFTWFDLKTGNHSLSAFWYKPGGKLQETTEYNFTAENKEFNTWLWLKLEKGKEKGFILPERGWSNFIGQWYVEIFLDGEFLEGKQFLVICW